MSTVVYRHESSLSTVKNNVKHTVKSSLIDGAKGLSFSFLEKKGEKFYKINAKQSEDKTFVVSEKKDDNEEKNTMKEADVMKMVKKDKNLKFVDDYVSKERKNYLKGGKKSSKRKSSKKSSKRKSSKKAKRSSKKKASKKSSKRKSSKKAKRSSKKKASKKKASKKSSKRKSSKKAKRSSKKKTSKKKASKKKASKKRGSRK